MRNKTVIIILAVAVLVTGAVAFAAYRSQNPSGLTVSKYRDSVPEDEKIDLNTATADKLMSLPGVGELLAARIIAYRSCIGTYTSTRQLLEVEGIGETLYNAIKFMVKV